MHARVSALRGAPETIEQGIERYRQALSTLRGIAGNRGAVLLIDRSGGRGIGVTLWESEDAMVESREQADQLRQRAAEEAHGEIESVDEYEVAVWDVD